MVGVVRGRVPPGTVLLPHNALARVTIVDEQGVAVLDTFSRPSHRIVDYRTAVSGIEPASLVGAPSFASVRQRVLALISGSRLVGHGLHNDFKVLGIEERVCAEVRDTSLFLPLRELAGTDPTRTPSLRTLASTVLKRTIQGVLAA